MTTHASTERTIFLEAIEKPSEAERNAFVQGACLGNPQLQAEVRVLLRAHQESGDLLDAPEALLPTIDQPTEQIGALIGPYKLLEQIGEGGMGLVYMAEQQRPLRRLVALKLIKPGMDSRQVIARFEAEKQALAMMDHPNIAKVFDAGTTGEKDEGGRMKDENRTSGDSGSSFIPHPSSFAATGRPYFAMELVRGIPINEFCEQKRLTVRERLELFIQVCQAVQHAHQKGIIHRDLKPTNVLVTMHDALAVPKVIDFGIAKALSPLPLPLGEGRGEGASTNLNPEPRTLNPPYTGFAQLVGTPLYMSPEQAEMNQLGVDTRSDVYSLGVLLYELLTGTTPFDKERLKSATFDEMRRIIREEEPETVSQRLAKTVNRRAHAAHSEKPGVDAGVNRRVHAAWLWPHRREGTAAKRWSAALSELDWIVMRALEKDRSRRYESASALATDIQRYLSDEPVLACPPTTMYRFQKFARKHKPALATAIAIAASLLLGTTVSAWQAVRATTAEAQANANEAQAQEKAKEAKEQAQEASAQRNEAQQQRDEAQRQRDEVRALNEKLQATQAELHRTLYTAHMNLARHAWEAGVTDQVMELLDQHRPKPGETDLRGFEWHYLYRMCHSDLLTLKGHAGGVESVAYSPDGKRLASASGDKTVKVWDAQTGQELFTLKGHSARVRSVAFSPDGKRLASGSSGRGERNEPVPVEVKVWDAQTGQELLSLKGHTDYVSSVAFNPDGKLLASASADNTVKVWDTQTGQELLTFKGHTSGVYSVVFSPDGSRLASGTMDKGAKVWDAQTGQELLTLKNTYFSVAFSPDGKRLAGAGGGSTVKVWDAQTGQEFLTLKHNGFINSVAFSPDGKRLASASGNKTVKVWDAQTGQELLAFKGHSSHVGSVAYSPDGKRVASASFDGTVKIWDATTIPEDRTFGGHTENVTSVAYSPDGKRLASASGDKTVKVWDVRTGQELLTLKGHSALVWSVAYSPDGKRLASTAWDQTVKVWDAQTGQELLTLKGRDRVAFSPDGKRLASAFGDNTAKVWDAHTGQELLSLKGHSGAVRTVAFSPDGQRLASASLDKTVKVWDAQTAQELLTIKGHTDFVISAAFSPDGKRLVSGGYDGNVKVWDAQTGQELLSLKGHTARVAHLVFSPDGKRLATYSDDHTVKVWDAQTLQEMLTLKRGSGLGVAFSPDGHRLAGAWDKRLKIWDATPLPEKP